MTTNVTASQIAKLRRMVAEPTTATYSDDDIIEYIEAYPHIDEFGESPTDDDGTENTDWTPTYDLNAAAADVWQEKAAGVAQKFDFSADGGQYSTSQQYDQYMKQVRYYRARRMPSTARMVKWPDEGKAADTSWIGNLPESE